MIPNKEQKIKQQSQLDINIEKHNIKYHDNSGGVEEEADDLSVASLANFLGSVAWVKVAVTTDTLAVAGVATNVVRMVTLRVNALVLVLDRGLNSSYACILYIVMFFSIHL